MFQTYYNHIGQITRENLDKESSDYLLEVDFDDYLEYLIADARWEPLEWDENQVTVEPFSVKVQRRDEWRRGGTFQAEEQWLRFRIPISSHPQLDEYFKFSPSTIRGDEPDWVFKPGIIIYEVRATEQAVDKGIEPVLLSLGNRNKDIEAGNKQLHSRIRPVWEAKRKQLEEGHDTTQALLQKLNIPLHQDPNAKVKPVEIKPCVLRTVFEKPTPPKATGKPEPTLNRDDVTALVDFIDQYTRQFEVSPKTYEKMDEEELRDLLVGMINANYPGSTTGETFNRLGKTDISLRINAGHVLICECKFWSGAKGYADALDQLLNYLTWRQNYGVLIHYSKLRDATRAISEAERSIGEHPSFTEGTISKHSEARFSSRHVHPQDPDKSLEIYHLFVDLSV